MKKIINVTGMHCAHCASAVEEALTAIDGIAKAKVDLKAGTVTASMKSDVDDKLIIEAINAKGFEAGEITIKTGLFA
jgi:copper chaperone CopZ